MRKAVSGLLQHFGCLITEKHAYMQTYASAVCLLFNISSAFTRQLTETSASLVLLWESSSMGSVQLRLRPARKEGAVVEVGCKAPNLLAVQLTYHVCRLAMNDGSNQILLQELPIHQSLSKNMNKYIKEPGSGSWHVCFIPFCSSWLQWQPN